MMIPGGLQRQMQELGIREEDLQEEFILSSGPGGQNANKVATCVYLYHRLTGIRVRCQEERFQERNRIQARWLLCEKIKKRRQAQQRQAIARAEKLRRQRRRRSLAGKERMLADKKARGQQKATRQRVDLRKPENW